jgi:SAM-dependent methyltransferase
MSMTVPNCTICGGKSALLDVVDFNKSCEDRKGRLLPVAGIPIYYAICSICNFCWAPQMCAWDKEEFRKRVYNDGYREVDPEFLEVRPKMFATQVLKTFPALPPTVRHLDYGGGQGRLAQLLRARNWSSRSYDPFVDVDIRASNLGQFDLITAFEVFEHVPNVTDLMLSLKSMLSPDGVIMFSTSLSDGHLHRNKRLSWWYAAPRNGHISLFSKRSLITAGHSHGFKYGVLSNHFHVFVTTLPSWAAHLAGATRILSRVNPIFSRLLGPALKLES